MKILKQQTVKEIIKPICERCSTDSGHILPKEIIDKLLETKVSTKNDIEKWLEQKRQELEPKLDITKYETLPQTYKLIETRIKQLDELLKE